MPVSIHKKCSDLKRPEGRSLLCAVPRTALGAALCAALCAVTLLIPSCTGKDSSAEEGIRTVAVKTAAVEMRRLDDDLNSFGTISYRIKNDLTAQVEGIIIELNVKEGDHVRQGQQLARLRNVQLEIQREQYENAVESAGAALFIAQTGMEEARLGVESRLLALEKSALELRQQELELEDALETLNNRKELHDIGGITDAAYRSLELSVRSKETGIEVLKKEMEIAGLGLRDRDLLEAGYGIAPDREEKKQQLIELNTRSAAAEVAAAQASLRNAEKNLDAAQRLMDELTIRSRVSGVVGALYFENGEYVPENEKLSTVMDTSRVYAVFSIQEQDIINFAVGTALSIEIPSLKKNIPATIDEISPVADPQSGNFSVKAELDNSGLDIKPGMFVKCTIPRRQETFYPAIPETALVRSGGTEGSLFCAVNGFAVLKSIGIIAQKDGMVWVSSGLQEGERVIDKPSPFLKEGDYVEERDAP